MFSAISKVEKQRNVEVTSHSARLRRPNRDDQSKQQGQFKEMLAKSMARQRNYAHRAEPEGQDTEAAVWEGNGVTQSLFYQNGVDLGFFYR